MADNGKKLMALLKAGKLDEAQAQLNAEKVKAENEPDTIRQETGKSARFTKRGKPVELDKKDKWRLAD